MAKKDITRRNIPKRLRRKIRSINNGYLKIKNTRAAEKRLEKILIGA